MKEVPANALRVVPLGGLGEIGRNMMVFETADDMVVVDAGIMFPPQEMLGVDAIIPDITYITERRAKLRAYLITHGHEDHIGALPYVVPEIPAPIYATRLTQGLIDVKFRDLRGENIERVTLTTDFRADFGSIQAEFFSVAHSIPDAMGIALRTPAGLVVHTGDFKIDHTPVMSPPTDLPRLAAYGDEGIRLLCSDSTYADRAGHTPSERVVGEALEQIMLTAPGRVIIATFASQIARVQQIIHGAQVAGRTVFVTGRSMVQNVRMARELAYIRAEPGAVRDISEHARFPDEEVLIICTGGQGEPMSALARMATGDHRDVTLKSGDTVVLSSSPIPGNEAAVNRTIDNLYRVGADVRYTGGGDRDVHVHGHAAQEELKTVLGLTRPHHFIPIHGEFRHLTHHIRLAAATGVPGDQCHVLVDGAVFQITADTATTLADVPASYVYVDGLNVGGVDHTVLRDRRHLASEGVVVLVVAVDHQTGQIVGDVDLVSRGVADLDESPELNKRTVDRVYEALGREDHPVEWNLLQDILKGEISKFLYRETHQRPMVLPVAVEV